MNKETIALERTGKSACRYNEWIYRQVEPFLGKKVLEIGCGIGNITKLLLQDRRVIATDINLQHLEMFRERLNVRDSQLTVIEYDIARGDIGKLKEQEVDTIVCLNVLEHIKEDILALKNMFQIIIPGGNLILLVPAGKWLYGSLDRHLEHHRRYKRKDLEERITQAGFKVIKCFYFNFFGIFAWFVSSKVLKKTVAENFQISLFDFFVPYFQRIERVIPPPVGLSLICIARKPI